jgi:hypothetical protein
MTKISFTSNRYWLNENSTSRPEPTIKNIPEWFRKADRFAINPQTGKPWINPQDGGKVPTWKACPAIFDVMGTGYFLKTPCDIEFLLDENEKISCKVFDKKYQDFCTPRLPLPQFQAPMGYHEEHFAWWADWGVKVPEGYSILYTHPLNRYDLPFVTTNGVIDSDKVELLGTMPFFIFNGWTGILPAGTPYMQLIPFKRENWESSVIIEDPSQIYDKNVKNFEKYRVPDGGVYKNSVWEKRKYE